MPTGYESGKAWSPIGAQATVSTSAASRVWTLNEAAAYAGASSWPSPRYDGIEWIAGVNGTGSSGTLEFTGIPQTYNTLRFVLSTATIDTSGVTAVWVLNGDTSSEYRRAENYNNVSAGGVYNVLYSQENNGTYPKNRMPATSENVGNIWMEWPGYTQTSGNQQSWGQAQIMFSNTTNISTVGGVTYSPSTLAAITQVAVKTDHSSYHWDTNTRLDMYGIGTA